MHHDHPTYVYIGRPNPIDWDQVHKDKEQEKYRQSVQRQIQARQAWRQANPEISSRIEFDADIDMFIEYERQARIQAQQEQVRRTSWRWGWTGYYRVNNTQTQEMSDDSGDLHDNDIDGFDQDITKKGSYSHSQGSLESESTHLMICVIGLLTVLVIFVEVMIFSGFWKW